MVIMVARRESGCGGWSELRCVERETGMEGSPQAEAAATPAATTTTTTAANG